MQINEPKHQTSAVECRERVEDALAKIQSLKCKVTELRMQCEALKKSKLEEQKDLTCSECGRSIDQGQEVTLKDSHGEAKSYFHKNCFVTIWRSQTWIFDYHSPGFLRVSENQK